jgi:DNA-binding response OmpR family regulator
LHTEVPIRILIAEDDRAVAALLKRVLAEDGYAIDVALTGEEARLLAFVHDYDGIVLDVDLGDRHGFEILQELRASGRATPVLLYTGLNESDAIVRGLDAGADEYVVKPISNQEMRARVRSLLRRRSAALIAEQLVVGELRMNRLTRRVMHRGSEVDLTPREMRLLEHLMLKSGQVITRSELHDKVWDMHFDPSSNLVDVNIARLRKKLGVARDSVVLATRRGVGFALETVGLQNDQSGHEAYGLSSAHS